MKQIFATILVTISLSAHANIDSETTCLAKNIYHEARGETLQGKMAVGLVTLNRTNHWLFPKTICKVVYQPGQFTWTQQRGLKILEPQAWLDSVLVAQIVREFGEWYTPHFPALYFHNKEVRPLWLRSRIRVASIGNHIFYK